MEDEERASERAGAEATVIEGAAATDGFDLEAALVSDPRDRGELLSALVEAERQRDGFLDDVLRARAEFDNFRKRVTRDGAVQREHGRADVVLALLETLDDLDRAESAIAALGEAPEEGGLVHGLALVASRLRAALAGIGLERLDGIDVAFDPTIHEAVQHVERSAAAATPSDWAGASGAADDAPRVVQVLRAGYRLGERVLRPAMVVVAG